MSCFLIGHPLQGLCRPIAGPVPALARPDNGWIVWIILQRRAAATIHFGQSN